jgi:N-methylhydantoinase A/oxoprolinase/acetone carboxylase beta subunit
MPKCNRLSPAEQAIRLRLPRFAILTTFCHLDTVHYRWVAAGKRPAPLKDDTMIIGLDVGGTHTDVVLLDAQGLLKDVKVPTAAEDLFHTVLKGIEAVTAGIDAVHIQRVVLSTTLTTNAVLHQELEPVGILVTGGPGIDPEAYRIGENFFKVGGAMDHRGREIDPVDPEEIEQIASGLATRGIRYVAVIGKFAGRNPEHELAIERLLGDRFEKIFLGQHSSARLNFPRRIATTYLNAAVYPIHKHFFEAVTQSLSSQGLSLPLRILKADGGNMRFETSLNCPSQTILSGPAASVMGALAFAETNREILVMDIGGTTTDMAVLLNGAPLLNPMGIDVGGYKTLIRSLDTFSLAVGGDSAVRVDGADLKIGPQRAGPAMAFGGPVPTPTDALVAMGKMALGRRQKAIDGMAALAAQLSCSVSETAQMVFAQTCRQIMAAAAAFIDRINQKPVYTVHEMIDGHQVSPSKILILGGPAPYFAEQLDATTDYRVAVVPRWPVANAIGAALARTTCEVSLFADTEQGQVSAPEEDFRMPADSHFDIEKAIDQGLELLRRKALERGADPKHLSTEVLEALQFNMVRGFSTVGRNIRVKVQVKPGLIHGYEDIVAAM